MAEPASPRCGCVAVGDAGERPPRKSAESRLDSWVHPIDAEAKIKQPAGVESLPKRNETNPDLMAFRER